MVLGNVIIAAFKFNKLICLLLNAVQIEVTVSIRTVLDNHLAVCTKFIVTRHEVGSRENVLCEIDFLVGNILVVLGNIVIAAFKFDKLICLLLDTVQIEVTVSFRAVLDDHLPVSTEFIVTGHEVGSCKDVLCEIDSLVGNILVVLGNIVIASVNLYKPVGMNLLPVFVNPSVNGTVIYFHLAICAKMIYSGRNKVICLYRHGLILCNAPETVKSASDTAIIVIAVYVGKSLLGLPVFDNIKIAVEFIQPISRMHRRIDRTVIPKIIPDAGGCRTVLNKPNAGIHI